MLKYSKSHYLNWGSEMVVGVKQDDKWKASLGKTGNEEKPAEMAERMSSLFGVELTTIVDSLPARIAGQKAEEQEAKSRMDAADQKVKTELQKLSADQRSGYDDMLAMRGMLETKRMALSELVNDDASPKESIKGEADAIEELENEIEARQTQLPESLRKADEKAQESRNRYVYELSERKALEESERKSSELLNLEFDSAFEEAREKAQEGRTNQDGTKELGIKDLAGQFGKGKYANIDEYQSMLKQEGKRLDAKAKALWGEGTELGTLDALFHELQQYQNKSGRGGRLYALGQHFGLESKTGQARKVTDLSKLLDKAEIRKAIEEYEEITIKRNAIRAALEEGKKGAYGTYTFINKMADGDADELKKYGLSNSVILRTPEVLLEEANEEAKDKLEALVGRRVDEVIEKFNSKKTKPSTDERKRLNGMFQQVYVEVAYALPQSFSNLSESDRKTLEYQRRRLDETIDKFCKRFDIKQEKKNMTQEYVDTMVDHFQDMVKWDESELIERSMKTYWDVVSIFSSANNISVREADETLNDWVARHLALAMAFRNAGLETAKGPLQKGLEIAAVATTD